MQKNTLPLLALLFGAIILLSGCVREKPVFPGIPPGGGSDGVLRLRLVPTWEGQPFQSFVELNNISNYRLQVEKVQFYLGDIRLTNEGASKVLSPIEFVDLTDGPVEFELPGATGNWTGLAMGLGVPPEPNHSDPTLYDNQHPLSVANGMHWNWTTGYVFLKFEGRYDLDAGNSGPFPSTYSLHTGRDEVYEVIGFQPSEPFSIGAAGSATATIHVAIDRFFHSSEAGIIDLAVENQSHGMNVPLSVKLTTNVLNSLTLE